MGDSDLPADIKKLIAQSREAKANAYCIHSRFRVGASLLAKDGTVFHGCNVENVSYSMTICAERCAFCKAISEGYREFKAIAVSSDMEGKFISPCGACRQVMYELGGKDLDVYLTKPDLTWKRLTMEELMPLPFDEFTVLSK